MFKPFQAPLDTALAVAPRPASARSTPAVATSLTSVTAHERRRMRRSNVGGRYSFRFVSLAVAQEERERVTWWALLDVGYMVRGEAG